MHYKRLHAGLSLPPQHVEESWQSAEFFANKVSIQAMTMVLSICISPPEP